MSIPFRERNPVPIGAAGLLVIGLVLFLSFNIRSIPSSVAASTTARRSARPAA